MKPIHINKTILSPLLETFIDGKIKNYKGVYLGPTDKIIALEEADW